MALLSTVLLFTASIVGYITEKKIIINPVTIFCGLWSIVILFSSFGFYTMNVASDNTYLLFLVGALCFVAGYYTNKIVLKKYQFKIDKGYISSRQSKEVPRYNMLYIVTLICIIYLLLNLLNLIRQAGTMKLGVIQALLQSGDYKSSSSSIVNAISLLVVSPISFAIPAITAVDFWYGRRDRKLLSLTIVLTVVNMLSSANRTTLMLFIIFLVLVAYLQIFQNRKIKVTSNRGKKRNIKKYIKLLIVVGIIAFVLMTISRGTRIFRNIYLNIAMSPRMFEIWSKTIEEEHIYGYGIGSLLGFFYPICYIIKNLFGLNSLPSVVQSMYNWTMLTDSKWVWPGDKITANAYVSLFWFFYMDARIIGILAGAFIFGFVASRSFQMALSKPNNVKHITYYCIIFYSVLFSFVRLQFTLSKFVLAVIFVLFFAYKRVQEREVPKK